MASSRYDNEIILDISIWPCYSEYMIDYVLLHSLIRRAKYDDIATYVDTLNIDQLYDMSLYSQSQYLRSVAEAVLEDMPAVI